MILIYSKDVDGFVNQVIDCLKEDFIRIGDRNPINIKEILLNKSDDFKINSSFYDTINLKKIKAIWFNGGFINSNNSSYEDRCYQTLIDSFLTNLPANKIGKLYHEFEINKLYASLEAKRQGFRVPETLITGNKKRLIKFYSKYKKGIICKRIVDELYYSNKEYFYNFGHTFSINQKILNDVPNEFALSLFQERILPEFEVRVIYIKSRFYAMSIHVFDDDIDYRKKLKSLTNIRIIPFRLPKNIKIKLKKVFNNLNLNYGSADLMYYNSEFYFLEINPAGQIGFVNEACNYYIEEELAKLLQNEG